MLRKGMGITENNQFHACPCHRHVHASKVAQESDLSLFVGAHHRDDDDVTLLSLKTVNGIDADEMTIGFEELHFLDQLTNILHLCAVGGDDAHIDALLENALFADLFEALIPQHFSLTIFISS